MLKISAGVRPFHAASCRGAREVVELRAGECERRGLEVGDRVAWASYQAPGRPARPTRTAAAAVPRAVAGAGPRREPRRALRQARALPARRPTGRVPRRHRPGRPAARARGRRRTRGGGARRRRQHRRRPRCGERRACAQSGRPDLPRGRRGRGRPGAGRNAHLRQVGRVRGARRRRRRDGSRSRPWLGSSTSPLQDRPRSTIVRARGIRGMPEDDVSDQLTDLAAHARQEPRRPVEAPVAEAAVDRLRSVLLAGASPQVERQLRQATARSDVILAGSRHDPAAERARALTFAADAHRRARRRGRAGRSRRSGRRRRARGRARRRPRGHRLHALPGRRRRTAAVRAPAADRDRPAAARCSSTCASSMRCRSGAAAPRARRNASSTWARARPAARPGARCGPRFAAARRCTSRGSRRIDRLPSTGFSSSPAPSSGEQPSPTARRHPPSSPPPPRALEPIVEREFLLERSQQREHALVAASERRLTRLAFDLHDGPMQDVLALAGEVRALQRRSRPVHPREPPGTGLGPFRRRSRPARRARPLAPRDRPFARDLEHRLAAARRGHPPGRRGLRGPHRDRRRTSTFAARSTRSPTPSGSSSSARSRRRFSNVREHSGASSVGVTVRARRSTTDVSITDDGRGFDVTRGLAQAAQQRPPRCRRDQRARSPARRHLRHRQPAGRADDAPVQPPPVGAARSRRGQRSP